MLYNSLLTSTGREEYRALNVGELGLTYPTLSFVCDSKFESNGRALARVKTINDLINVGKENMMNYAYPRYGSIRADEMIREIEEKLAKLGLKFKDTDFTIGDVRISMLDIQPDEAKRLKVIADRLETLDNLITYGIRGIERTYGKSDTRFINDLELALERFGLRFEDSHRKVNMENAFTRKSLRAELFEQENEKKVSLRPRGGSARQPRQPSEPSNSPIKAYKRSGYIPNLVDLSSADQEKKLGADVDNLFLPQALVSRLHLSGIHKIGDVVNADSAKLRECLTEQSIQTLVLELSRHGIDLPSSGYAVVNNNRIVKVEKLFKRGQKRGAQPADDRGGETEPGDGE